MNLAAGFPAARYAVSSLGLAALAVSAIAMKPEPPPPAAVYDEAFVPWQAQIRQLTVVGSPAHTEMTWTIQPLATAFADCASSATRVTLYAHFSGGVITELSALGDDVAANRCAIHTSARLTAPVLDEMDVMIPIDFEPRMAFD